MASSYLFSTLTWIIATSCSPKGIQGKLWFFTDPTLDACVYL